MLAFILSPIGKILGGAGLALVAFLGFRLWLAEHDAGVRKGYVLATEAAAAQAQADEMERQRDDAEEALDEARKQQAADNAADAVKTAQTAQDTTDYEKRLAATKRQCFLDADRVNFILQH